MSDLYWLTDEQVARLQPYFPRTGNVLALAEPIILLSRYHHPDHARHLVGQGNRSNLRGSRPRTSLSQLSGNTPLRTTHRIRLIAPRIRSLRMSACPIC